MPLPQSGRHIGGQIDDAIYLPFTGVHAQGPLDHIDRLPAYMAHFAYAEPTAQHQQKHRAVFQRIDHPKEHDDLGFRHRLGEPRGHENVMAWELNGRLRQDPVVTQEAKEARSPWR